MYSYDANWISPYLGGMMKTVPSTLKTWFVIHFIIDLLVAIPLFFVPEWFLNLMGWVEIDNLLARIAGAAFFGIGIQSYFARHATVESYVGVLNLKIIWSGFAVVP